MEKEANIERDPLPKFRSYILEMGILSEEDLMGIEQEVLQCVDDAIHFVDTSPKSVRCMLTIRCFVPASLQQVSILKYISKHTCPGI